MALEATQSESSLGVEHSRDSILRQKESSNALTQLDVPLTKVDSQWDQPSTACSLLSEDTIRENMIKHKKDILDSLNPSKIFQLLQDFGLDENLDIDSTEQASEVFKEVQKRRAYSAFLNSLERDTEHMGHRYIVSLLRGQEFAKEEEIEESQVLKDRLTEHLSSVIKFLSVEALRPYLLSTELTTVEELEELQSPYYTSRDKAEKLISILRTKGPTAHCTFVHKCLAEEKEHCSHGELYSKLTASRETRKRKQNDDLLPPRKAIKHTPFVLESPGGITSRKYVEVMTKIRQYHNMGKDKWKAAEEECMKEVNAADNPLEMKIAILLESTVPFVLEKDTKKVLYRVDKARAMCKELYKETPNAQVLEGRCEWIMALYYHHTAEYDKAHTHIEKAFGLISNYEGEEMILVSYTHGCIILESKTTLADLTKAINSLQFASSLASQEDYGLNMEVCCKIQLARAHAKLSAIPQRQKRDCRESMKEAKRHLNEIEHKNLLPQVQCLYFCTCSEVYKMAGHNEQAEAYASLNLKRTDTLLQ